MIKELYIDYQRLMKNQANRVKLLMAQDHIETRKELAERINRSPSSVTEHLNTKEDLSESFLLQLESKLGWSSKWIKTGVGPERLSKAFGPHSHPNGAHVHVDSPNVLETDDTNARSLGVHDPDVYQDVKFISYNVWASFTDNFGDFDFQDVKATYPVYLPRLNFPITDRHMVFEILGDSMEERLYNRDVVLTELVDDGNFDYLNSHIYVVAYRNQLVVKRVIDNDLLVNGTLTLHSDNKKHGKITIRREDIRYIWKFIAIVYSTAV